MSASSHFDSLGQSRMVNVADKDVTRRAARASARVRMSPETLRAVLDHRTAKGDVVEVARLAGIMAAKRTSDLIPLCHPLPLDAVSVSLEAEDDETLRIEATVETTARTGVEMEALTAVSIASLTLYDMCKSIDRNMTIEQIRLEEKFGGRSGHFQREAKDVP